MSRYGADARRAATGTEAVGTGCTGWAAAAVAASAAPNTRNRFTENPNWKSRQKYIAFIQYCRLLTLRQAQGEGINKRLMLSLSKHET
jgi:hypothetical protein